MRFFIWITVAAMLLFGCSKKEKPAAEQKPATGQEKMAKEEPTAKPKPKVRTDRPTQIDPEKYVTTSSGLKYYDIIVGTGKTAKSGNVVEVHYTGWLTDGKRFDSSVLRGRPFSFPLGEGRVIRGWDEGVAGMKEGGVRQLVIPPELAYGKRGVSNVIPPDATLIFEVQLLSVK